MAFGSLGSLQFVIVAIFLLTAAFQGQQNPFRLGDILLFGFLLLAALFHILNVIKGRIRGRFVQIPLVVQRRRRRITASPFPAGRRQRRVIVVVLVVVVVDSGSMIATAGSRRRRLSSEATTAAATGAGIPVLRGCICICCRKQEERDRAKPCRHRKLHDRIRDRIRDRINLYPLCGKENDVIAWATTHTALHSSLDSFSIFGRKTTTSSVRFSRRWSGEWRWNVTKEQFLAFSASTVAGDR